MPKEAVEIGGIKYELHDRDAEIGDNVIITHIQPISEGIFEIGDIYKVESISGEGMVLASKDGDIAVIYRNEYKVILPVSSEIEPDEGTESDASILDVIAKIARSINAMDKRIYSLESDIKDLRANLTEELYESQSEIGDISREINDVRNLVHTDFDFLRRIQDELYGKIQGVHDYTLDLTETIEMHTDDIVMLDERTQDLVD